MGGGTPKIAYALAKTPNKPCEFLGYIFTLHKNLIVPEARYPRRG